MPPKVPTKCTTCRGKFKTQNNTILDKILDCMLVECENYGCTKKVLLKEKKEHAINCGFRQNIYCFCLNCQRKNLQQPLSDIKSHLKSVYSEKGFQIKDRYLPDFQEQFQVGTNEISMIYFGDKLLYIYMGKLQVFGTKQFKKCILIANARPEKAQKLKCRMNLLHDNKEIFSYNGNVFSIDETKDIRFWNSGGLIVPEEIFNKKLTFENSMVEIKVIQDLA